LERIFKEDLRAMTFMLKVAKTLFDFPFSWAMPEFKTMLDSELGNKFHFNTEVCQISLMRELIMREPLLCLPIINRL
jgi:hypothetical protein